MNWHKDIDLQECPLHNLKKKSTGIIYALVIVLDHQTYMQFPVLVA
jgi:hypothetical protein